MNIKKILFLFLFISFFIYSGVKADSNSLPQMSALPTGVEITAASAETKIFTLGSVAPVHNPSKFELELTTKGAAVSKVRMRDYADRDRENPQPLELLKTFGNANTMASTRLLLPEMGKAFPLDRLDWQSTGITKTADRVETISFYAVILKDGKEFIKLTKTYTLSPEDYLLDCLVTISNLDGSSVKAGLETTAAAGISKEDARRDARGVAAGFLTDTGDVDVAKFNLTKLAKNSGAKTDLFHKNAAYKFLWVAATNKYFAVITRPVPFDGNSLVPQWIAEKSVKCFDADAKADSGDENEIVSLKTETFTIASDAEQNCSFQVYIGPKDRDMFDSTVLYDELGFIKVIDFQACMGDTFRGLSFFILTAMNRLYDFIPNYGVVIIIFVFIVRVLLHPITKKSQVSMMKMSKLGPKAEEIKKKYANNKAEMQKQLGSLYKEQGVAPVLGCLPMLLQMPIWIALYSAIYAGIEFRGAPFLPFWITDLSSSDALFYFPQAVEKIPFIGAFIGSSFNLLPILLGVAMFAQQKMMPSSSAPSSNPQAAQQQKMMLWMMPAMMLLFLYRAPSGLNLYIMASTTAGVAEQYIIRKHIREKEEAEQAVLVPTTSKLGGKLKKKKPKPPIKFS
ncbi:MAG: membrane protein insertase YidC [Phycisphaerae bacterium]|nr:membrane protein insertase YidC [Phycisphaerae bacterium]